LSGTPRLCCWWPQDAIDGALIVLVGSGHLRASQDGKHLTQKQIDQSKLGVTDFRLESPTVPTNKKLALKKLFQEAGVPPTDEVDPNAARAFLDAMKELAKRAGGDPPLPRLPNPPLLGELSGLGGNEQLLAIYEARDELSGWRADWSKRAELIAKRYPRWQALEDLAAQARGLLVTVDLAPQIEAVRANRALLNDPDPVAPLVTTLTQALREALQQAREAYSTLHQEQKERFGSTDIWKRLTPEQQAEILNRQGVTGVPEIRVGTEQELMASLAEISLESWNTRRDALPQRFSRALEEAAKLLEPTAVRVTLPSATMRNEDEFRAWLDQVAAKVREQLGKGPVIV